MMTLQLDKIGTYLQLLRKLAGLTQAQLGERLNVSAQAVSNWERGLLLPDTASLPAIAQILDTTVDRILSGGEAPLTFRRRITTADIRRAMHCIQQLRETLGSSHFMYRTMISALDQKMNSSIELAFSSESAMEAYICEALIACLQQGDYVDRDDVRMHIDNPRAAEAVLHQLDAMGIK